MTTTPPVGRSDQRYDFYVCHAAEDRAFAAHLVDALAESHSTFLPQRPRFGASPDEAGATAQAEAAATVVVLSQQTLADARAQADIDRAVALAQGSGHRVIPVYVDAVDETLVPRALRGLTSIRADEVAVAAEGVLNCGQRFWGTLPAYANAAEQALQEEKESLREAYAQALAAGESTTAIADRLLEVERKLLSGGLHPGDRVGEYRLLRLLGDGRCAEVWEALGEDRRVALKVLKAARRRHAATRKRFVRGARTLAKLDNPRLVAVLDVGDEPDGLCYYAMPVMAGDLASHVNARRLLRTDVLRMVTEVAEGLAHLHAQDIAHGDLKPSNILIDHLGRANLADFDVFAELGEDQAARSMDDLVFAAPEVIDGAPASPSADGYALAMSAVFAFYGRRLPFHKVSANAAKFIGNLPVGAATEAVLARGVALEPDGRFPDVAGFATALAKALGEDLHAEFKATPDDRLGVELEALAELSGDWAPAVHAYDAAALNLGPQAAAPFHARLGRWLARMGEGAKALEHYQKAHEGEPQDVRLLDTLLTHVEAEGRWPALSLLLAERAQLAETPEEQAAVRAARARTLKEKLGHGQDALSEWKTVLELLEDDDDAATEAAALARELGDWGTVAELIERGIEAGAPDAREARRLELARLYMEELDDVAAGQRVLEEVLAENPRCRGALEVLRDHYSTARDWPALARTLESLVELSEGPERARHRLALGALRNDHLEDPNGAHACFAAVEASGACPPDQWALLKAGLARAGNHGALARVLERMIEVGAPEEAERRLELAALYAGPLGAPLQAQAHVVAAQRCGPDTPDFLVRVGDAHLAAGDHPAAVSLFRRAALRIDGPKQKLAVLQRIARISLQSGGPEARTWVETILHVDPTHRPSLEALRRIAVAAGELDTAVVVLRRLRSLALDPDDASAFTKLLREHRETDDAGPVLAQAAVAREARLARLAEAVEDPDDLEVWVRRMDEDLKSPGAEVLDLAERYVNAEVWWAAEEAYRLAEQLAGDPKVARAAREALSGLADRKRKMQLAKEAADAIPVVLELARDAEEGGDLDGALEGFLDALGRAPDVPAAEEGLRRLLRRGHAVERIAATLRPRMEARRDRLGMAELLAARVPLLPAAEQRRAWSVLADEFTAGGDKARAFEWQLRQFSMGSESAETRGALLEGALAAGRLGDLTAACAARFAVEPDEEAVVTVYRAALETRLEGDLSAGEDRQTRLALADLQSEPAAALALLAPLEDALPVLDRRIRLTQAVGDEPAYMAAVEAAIPLMPAGSPKADRCVVLAQAAEDEDQALAWFDAALEADPDHAAAKDGARKIRVASGDWAAVIEDLEQTAEMLAGAEKADCLLRAGLAYRDQLEDPARALDRFKAAREADPDNLELAEALAQACWEAGEYGGAADALEQLAEARPDDPERPTWIRQLARCAQERGDTGAARRYLRELLDADERDAGALEGMARLQQATEDFDGALRTWEDYLDYHGKGLEAGKEAVILYEMGSLKVALEDLASGHAFYRQSLEKEPRLETLDAMLALARRREDWTEYTVRARERLPMLPDEDARFEALLDIGLVELEHGDSTRSETVYHEALGLRPGSRVVVERLLDVYRSQRNWGDAVALLQRLADEGDPAQRAEHLLLMGLLLRDDARDLAGAIRVLDEASETDPTVLKYYGALDQALAQEADAEHQVVYYRRMLERARSHQLDQRMLQSLERRLGQADEAEAVRYDEAFESVEMVVDELESVEACEEPVAEMDVDDADIEELDLDDLDAAEVTSVPPRAAPLADFAMVSDLPRALDPEASSSGAFDASAMRSATDEAIEAHYARLKADPADVENYRALARVFRETRHYDEAWCVCRALVFMRLADEEEQRYYAENKSNAFRQAQRPLSDSDWPRLVHPDKSPLVDQLFTLLHEANQEAAAQKPAELQIGGQEIDPREPLPLNTVIRYVAQVIGVDVPVCFRDPAHRPGFHPINTGQPGLLVGPDMLESRQAEHLTFNAARSLYLGCTPANALAATQPGFDQRVDDLKEVVRTAAQYVQGGTLDSPHMTAYVKRFDVRVAEELAQLLGNMREDPAQHLDFGRWLAATEHTANRLALLLCDDLGVAARLLREDEWEYSNLSAQVRVQELVLFAVSREYFKLRRRLRLRIT